MRRRRNRVNTRFGRWSNVPVFVLLLGERETAAASAEPDAESASLFQRHIVWRETGVFDCFACGGERQRHGARHVFAIFRVELCFPIEGRNFGGDLDRETGRIESLDATDAALAFDQRLPISLASNAQGRHTPHSGDDYPAWTREPS